MRKVVHIVPALFGSENVFGGAERYALELARKMATQVPTALVSFGGRPRKEKRGALDIAVLRNFFNFKRFKYDPFNPLLYTHLRQASVIHYHQSGTMMATEALLYARATDTPIFSTHLGGAGQGLHRLMDVTDWYQGHLHISQFSLRSCNYKNHAKQKIILGGIDTDRFSPDPAVQGSGGALYVGRLLPHKGINYILEGLPTEMPLDIVGRPAAYAQRYYQLLRKLAVGKRVTFQEDLDDDGIINAYRRALCIILPSVHETVFGAHYSIPELLGQTLLEGMACGAPAITTSIASLPELIEDGVSGFIVPPNDPKALAEKIQWLHDHRDEARRMGEAARRRVLDVFTWDRVVARCLDAYRTLGGARI